MVLPAGSDKENVCQRSFIFNSLFSLLRESRNCISKFRRKLLELESVVKYFNSWHTFGRVVVCPGLGFFMVEHL